MKSLTRIRLINWHLFADATISCQGTTYFIGVNGAGKSTILDAVQFALVGGQRDVKFNQAALAGGKRSLASYVRGELGTEGQRYLRGDATGVVALEFRNPDSTSFVHGAVVDAFEDGRGPEVLYFLVQQAGLSDDWFFQPGPPAGRVFDSRAFKRHLEHFALPPGARAQVFNRVEDYRVHLLNRLGQLRDSFPAKVVKGLAFTPLTDIRGFVHSYLLDENLVNVHDLKEQLETLHHFEGLAADIRERVAALERVAELDRERLAQRRRRLNNGYVRRRAQADQQSTQLQARQRELEETRLALVRAGQERERLAGDLERAQAGLLEAQLALRSDVTASREATLREKLAALEAELRELGQRQARVQALLASEVHDAQQLQELLRADGQPTPPEIESFLADPPAGLPGLQTALETLGRAYATQAALLDERARALREEAALVDGEIRRLRAGDREASYEAEAPEAARLRRLLRAELGLAADEVAFLCTVLQVPDESWQDAVEGVLGQNRFTLLVPPELYAAAMRLYRERRHTDQLHGVAVLDGDRLLQHARPAGPDSLAAEVHSVHPAGRAFVDLVLGSYVRCDTLDALREHRTAVTRECFVRRNFTTSHLNPRAYGRWFIGDRAIPRRIQQLEARLAEIATELVGLNEQASAVRERLALTRDKARRLVEIEHALAGLDRLPAVAAEYDALQAELAALDTRQVEALRAEVGRRQAECDRARDELARLDRQAGALDQQAESLSSAVIPGLAQAAAEAAQAVDQFLLAEGAGEPESRAENEREYQRRCERQPLETVLANALRYESDYQSAEARSRDKLREAKHEYSLRYDFGYDEAEDAARYAVERERFIASELPQYEERIAEQRRLAEQELVENFIHRLREQIEDARQQLDFLNTTLRDLRFGGERFEFISHPAPAVRPVYDMIMDSQQILGDSLFESDFRQKHQAGWDLLFERLTAGPDEGLVPELRELQDYRNYLEYDVRIHYPNNDRALLSQINQKKSGGETTTPYYVAMAASFAQAYRLNQPRPSDTIRLALFDEAFSKMDTARTASALQFMRDTGLQVLLATPPDKSGALLAHVDSVRTVVRKDSHSFVVEIDRGELLKQIERTAPGPVGRD
jgi:uncharacterized protein YPO0396